VKGIPTADQVRAHIRAHYADFRDADVELFDAHNHVIYRVILPGGRTYAIRMINPESYRRGEWISVAEEHDILAAIAGTGLGPKTYGCDDRLVEPFILQEFVTATCYNDLKPLSDEHLASAARAIALLNEEPISPDRFPFMRQYIHKGYARASAAWYFRLADSIRRLPRRDVLRWTARILPLARKASRLLAKAEYLLPSEFSFHFDGAHTGNTYWRDGKTMFLDWQKVSWRNDPSFTLVRFATSTAEQGIVSERVFETLVNTYQQVRPVPEFDEIAVFRLMERQVADLVFVLWDHTRRRDAQPVEEGTSIVPRYREVRRALQRY